MNHRRVRAPLLALFLPLAFAPFSHAAEPPSAHPLAGIPITELARSERREGGRKLTFIRIHHPDTPPRAEAPPVPVPEPTEAELAREAEREAKARHSVTLMGSVYAGDSGSPSVTEVRWLWREREEAGETLREARAWVPIDLRLVDHRSELECSEAIFHFSIFVSVARLAELRESEHPPALAHFAGEDPPAYIFEGTQADAERLEPALLGLEALLAYEALHRPELAQKLAEREARNAAQAREAALNPPRPKDCVIYFWKASR